MPPERNKKVRENKKEEKEKLWVRSATIRPHHVTGIQSVRDAIAGTTSVDDLARSHIIGRYDAKIARRGKDKSGYDDDVVDENILSLVNQIAVLRKYFNTLRTLPDSAYVGLDLDLDGLCDACPIGKHCTGTNYESTKKPRSTFNSEVGQLLIIETNLMMNGFVEGVDYIRVMTDHTLYNYGGRILADSAPGTVEKVVFPSITVRMGALRKICK
ncbi:MAG TPA: hypothetical protein VF189_06620 [Patescibacteria group bacterium]